MAAPSSTAVPQATLPVTQQQQDGGRREGSPLSPEKGGRAPASLTPGRSPRPDLRRCLRLLPQQRHTAATDGCPTRSLRSRPVLSRDTGSPSADTKDGEGVQAAVSTRKSFRRAAPRNPPLGRLPLILADPRPHRASHPFLPRTQPTNPPGHTTGRLWANGCHLTTNVP